MKPRRTLRVRVSSPSSASSSLCRTRKRLICEPASSLVGGEVGVDLLDALADQLVDLGLLRQVGVAGVGQVAPLGPVADRLEVDVDERADLLAPVAEGHRFLDVREELELVLDVLGEQQHDE